MEPDSRTTEGRFAKGKSGNPGGRPKALVELKLLAQKHTAEAIKTLASIMKNSDNDQARIAAANALLDRGYGKPTQPLSDADGSNLPSLPLYVEFVSTTNAARQDQPEQAQSVH